MRSIMIISLAFLLLNAPRPALAQNGPPPDAPLVPLSKMRIGPARDELQSNTGATESQAGRIPLSEFKTGSHRPNAIIPFSTGLPTSNQ
jgi:hypothetical protein